LRLPLAGAHEHRFHNMAIPDFQSVMRPLMEFLADGKEHSLRESLAYLAKHFQLTAEDQRTLLPSGRQEVFKNRLAWAKAHLRMAGLIEPTARGVFKITRRGLDVLQGHGGPIDLRVLKQQPGYAEARDRKREDSGDRPGDDPREQPQTPEELMEQSFEALRENLSREILAKLKGASPSFFERIVVEVLVRMGYGGTRKDAGQALGKSGDEGIDGIIKEDRLGLDTIYIQAKRWEQTVGRPEIQKFAGALQGFRARKGIFITTSAFSKEAADYASRIDSRIVLIDGQQLCHLMIDYGVGVSSVATYEVRRLDNDYFSEETA
jgi:restriction system protein